MDLQEPFFLVNDFLASGQKELQDVIKEIKKKPAEYTSKALFLKNFTHGMVRGHINLREKHGTIEQQEKKELKQNLEKKREDILTKIEELKKAQETLEKSEVKVPEMPESKAPEAPKSKVLITSRVTNKTMVSRAIEGANYLIQEPPLLEEDKKSISDIKSNFSEFNEDKIKQKLSDLSPERYDILRYFLVRDMKVAGKLSPLIEDSEVQEIICDGINMQLNVRLENNVFTTNIKYHTDQELNEQLYRLATLAGKPLTEDNPFLEGPINTDFMIEGNLSTEYFPGKFVIKRL